MMVAVGGTNPSPDTRPAAVLPTDRLRTPGTDWIKVYHDLLLLQIVEQRRDGSYAVLAAFGRYERDTIRALLRTAPADCEAD